MDSNWAASNLADRKKIYEKLYRIATVTGRGAGARHLERAEQPVDPRKVTLL